MFKRGEIVQGKNISKYEKLANKCGKEESLKKCVTQL